MQQILLIGNRQGVDRGFTLLEIAIVLLMLTILAGLVLPNIFRNSRGMETKIAFRQLGHDIAQLTAEAKGTGMMGKMVFTPKSDEYQVIFGKETLSRPLNGLVFAGEEPLELEFSSQGMKDGLDSIVFKDTDGTSHVFSINTLKGR